MPPSYILALFSLSAIAVSVKAEVETIWTAGVSETSGWYDFNKVDPTATDGDNNLCWAASASNIINWWQDRYTLPGTIPKGEAVWDKFKEVSTDIGGSAACAVQWWTVGEYSAVVNANNYLARKGYYAISQSAITTNVTNFTGYIDPLVNNSLTFYDTMDFIKSESHVTGKIIVDNLIAGNVISLGMSSTGGDVQHAITLWGAEYEKTEDNVEIKALWLTDSDDKQYGRNTNGIFRAEINGTVDVISENNTLPLLKFSEDDGQYYSLVSATGDLYISGATILNVSESDTWGLAIIPEPNTISMSLVVLATALTMRRKRKFQRK